MSEHPFEKYIGGKFESQRQSQRGISLTMDMNGASHWLESKFSQLFTQRRMKNKTHGGFTEILPIDRFIDPTHIDEELREILAQDLQVRYYEGSEGRQLSFFSRSSSHPGYPFLRMDLGNNSIYLSPYFEIGEIVGYLDLMTANDSVKLCRQIIIDNLKKIGTSES